MPRRPLALLAVAVGAAALPAPALGQTPPTPTTPAPPPPPGPATGRMSIGVVGGLATRERRYFARGQRVVVVGSVRPFVTGQRATLYIVRGGRTVHRMRATIRRGPGGVGRVVWRFVAHRRGVLRLMARHKATSSQVAFRSRSRRIRVVLWSAGAGRRGVRVLLLQRALHSLGYAVPVTGHFDGGTSRAVLTYRKANGMGRTGYASTAVYRRLFRSRGAFRPKYPGAGRHVEFDWSRQVLALVNGARPWRVYHASSGKPSTPTVFGSFRFYRKQPGTNAHGMVYSSYFVGGYAVHGYSSVPPYAASHGCIRVPIPNAVEIYKWIPRGMRMFVYR